MKSLCYLPFEMNLQKKASVRSKKGKVDLQRFCLLPGKRKERKKEKRVFFRKESTPNNYVKFYWDFLSKYMLIREFIVILITMMFMILQLKTKCATKTNVYSYKHTKCKSQSHSHDDSSWFTKNPWKKNYEPIFMKGEKSEKW